jgi:hypothetical protein
MKLLIPQKTYPQKLHLALRDNTKTKLPLLHLLLIGELSQIPDVLLRSLELQ